MKEQEKQYLILNTSDDTYFIGTLKEVETWITDQANYEGYDIEDYVSYLELHPYGEAIEFSAERKVEFKFKISMGVK